MYNGITIVSIEMSDNKKKKKKSMLFLLKSTESAYSMPRKHSSGTIQSKLQFKKYDPIVRKHVPFVMAKIK